MSSGCAEANEIGEDLELRITESESALEHVPKTETFRYDARTTTLLEGRPERPLAGVLLLEEGTPVEIKTTRPWVRNGVGRCRGRFYIKQPSHEVLLEAGGAYYLAVYERRQTPSGPEVEIVAAIIVPASIVEELRGSWCETGRADGPVARLSWTAVLREDDLESGVVVA
ncbi:hypothetical protein [Halorarum salinum]|uniref:Uncharacterized protein n=1 Tax=Halorarum salinum TaxID=2743089 RepID=A0A7D5LAY7_9EURY|nr:hypothetical protein [Halobaculum salinum]QLG62190.1 hypothetical protein HUG12_10780 [Halobaculum salinum]